MQRQSVLPALGFLLAACSSAAEPAPDAFVISEDRTWTIPDGMGIDGAVIYGDTVWSWDRHGRIFRGDPSGGRELADSGGRSLLALAITGRGLERVDDHPVQRGPIAALGRTVKDPLPYPGRIVSVAVAEDALVIGQETGDSTTVLWETEEGGWISVVSFEQAVSLVPQGGAVLATTVEPPFRTSLVQRTGVLHGWLMDSALHAAVDTMGGRPAALPLVGIDNGEFVQVVADLTSDRRIVARLDAFVAADTLSKRLLGLRDLGQIELVAYTWRRRDQP